MCLKLAVRGAPNTKRHPQHGLSLVGNDRISEAVDFEIFWYTQLYTSNTIFNAQTLCRPHVKIADEKMVLSKHLPGATNNTQSLLRLIEVLAPIKISSSSSSSSSPSSFLPVDIYTPFHTNKSTKNACLCPAPDRRLDVRLESGSETVLPPGFAGKIFGRNAFEQRSKPLWYSIILIYFL